MTISTGTPSTTTPNSLPGPFNHLKRWITGPTPVSILLALLIGALFMLLAGLHPFNGYTAMMTGSFGTGPGISHTLQRAIPIIGIGIAIAIAFRAGVLNLGTEGQAGLGALAGGLVAIYVPGPGPLILVAALVSAFIVGALWGVIAATLHNLMGVPVLLSTLLLNYPARYFASWLIRFTLDEPESTLVASEQVRPDAHIGMLVARDSPLAEHLRHTFGPTSPVTAVLTGVNWSVIVLIVVVVAVVFMNRRTRYGFESGLSGHNAQFVRYSGVAPASLTLRTMTLSGGIAGLFGVMLTIGAPNTRLIEGAFVQTSYAWTALLVTLLALYRPVSIVVAGLFFAAIIVGSEALGRDFGLSPQIASVIQALVIILLTFRVTVKGVRRSRGRVTGEAVPEQVGGTEARTAGAETTGVEVSGATGAETARAEAARARATTPERKESTP